MDRDWAAVPRWQGRVEGGRKEGLKQRLPAGDIAASSIVAGCPQYFPCGDWPEVDEMSGMPVFGNYPSGSAVAELLPPFGRWGLATGTAASGPALPPSDALMS